MSAALLGCSPAPSPVAVPVPAASTAPPQTAVAPASASAAVAAPSGVWVDLDTLSVDLESGRVRPRRSSGSHVRAVDGRVELVEDEKVLWSRAALVPEGGSSLLLTATSVVVGDGTRLVGLGREAGASIWTARGPTALLQRWRGDAKNRIPEVVVAVDGRATLGAGERRSVSGRAAATGKEIFRHDLPPDRPLRTSIEDGHIFVVQGATSTTVMDLERAALVSRRGRMGQTFNEAARWAGGYTWSSGDLILTSDKRLARIEYTSTSPEYVGSTVWSLPPIPGTQGGALLTGPVDQSPQWSDKRICFYGFDPERDEPVSIAIVEALARDPAGSNKSAAIFRGSVAPLGRACGSREVRIMDEEPHDHHRRRL